MNHLQFKYQAKTIRFLSEQELGSYGLEFVVVFLEFEMEKYLF